MKDKISQAHSNDIVSREKISDLNLKYYEQQEEINKLQHTIKNQQQQIQSLKLKLNNMSCKIDPINSESQSQIQDSESNSEDDGYCNNHVNKRNHSNITEKQPTSPKSFFRAYCNHWTGLDFHNI